MKHASPQSQLAVGIVYGFAEGSLTGRRLRKALRQAGFKTTTPAQADIIIAHSGGYLVLPALMRATTIVYIGANTWNEPLFTSLKQKLRYDYAEHRQNGQLFTWLLHGLRNDIYILKLPHTFRLAQGLRHKTLPPPKATHTVVVKNRHDSYSTVESLLQWTDITTYLSLDGGHDNIWDNPAPYVDVIQSLQRG